MRNENISSEFSSEKINKRKEKKRVSCRAGLPREYKCIIFFCKIPGVFAAVRGAAVEHEEPDGGRSSSSGSSTVKHFVQI